MHCGVHAQFVQRQQWKQHELNAAGMLSGLPSEHVTLLTWKVHAITHSTQHRTSHHGSLITTHVTDMHMKGCWMPHVQMQHRTPLDCDPLADTQKDYQLL